MPFRAQSGPTGGSGLPGRSRSLIVSVEVGCFPAAAVENSKSEFPWQRPGSTHLPLVQSVSDCAQKCISISENFSQKPKNKNLTKTVLSVVTSRRVFNPFKLPMGRVALG